MVLKKTSRTQKTSDPAVQNDSPARPSARRRQPAAKASPKAAAPTPAVRTRSPRPTRTSTTAAVPAVPAPVETPEIVAQIPVEPAPLGTPVTAASPMRAITDEDVRVRAYFLSLEHGGRGHAADFWLLAERELRADAERD